MLLFLFTCLFYLNAYDELPVVDGVPFETVLDGTRGLAEVFINEVPGGTVEFTVNEDGDPVLTGKGLRLILALAVKPEILESIIDGNHSITDGELELPGILVAYDPLSLSLFFTVSSSAMIPRQLGLPPSAPEGGVVILPEKFSATLGVALSVEPVWEFGEPDASELKASLSLAPAFRLFGLVAEGGIDAGYSESFWAGLREARLVMDFQGIGARVALGTVAPAFASFRTHKRLVGLGFYSEASMPGGKHFRSSPLEEVHISRPADISVEINGIVVRNYHLTGGSYKFSELPLDTGLNTVAIRIDEEGSPPRTLTIGLPFDGDLLPPGEMDYSLYLGLERDSLEVPLAYASFAMGATPYLELGVAASAGPDSLMGEGSMLWASPAGSLRLSSAASFEIPGASSSIPEFAGRLEWRLSIPDNQSLPRFGAGVEYRAAGFRSSALETLEPSPASWLASLQVSQRLPGGAGSFSVSGNSGFSSGILAHGTVYAGVFVVASATASCTLSGGFDWRLASGFEPRASIALAVVPSTRRSVFFRQDLVRIDPSIQIDIPLGAHEQFGIGLGKHGLSSDLDQLREAGINGRYHGDLLDLFAAASYMAASRDDLGRAKFSLSASSAVAFAGGYFGLSNRISDAFLFIVPRQELGDSMVVLQPWDGKAVASEAGTPRLVADVRSYRQFSASVLMPDSPVDRRPVPETVRIMPAYRSGTVVGIGAASILAIKGRLVNGQGVVRALLSGAIVRSGGNGERIGSTFSDALGQFEYYGIPAGAYLITWSDGSTSSIPAIVEGALMTDLGDVVATPAGKGVD